MRRRHEIRFRSYDRLFPNQETVPVGGFGNLIALPLQGAARKNGNSVFVDEHFLPCPDQWDFLAHLDKLSLQQVEHLNRQLGESDELGELIDTNEDEPQPWEKRALTVQLERNDFPETVAIVRSNMIYIEKRGVSERALNKIKRLAAFKNPEFYRSLAMRLSTWNKPRIISMSSETKNYLGLPRGCEPSLIELLERSAATFVISDKREAGHIIDVAFNGTLRPEQQIVADTLLQYDSGVLAATTAFGKTVIGTSLIASRKVNTLILVHTSTLLTQWISALQHFLVARTFIADDTNKQRAESSPTIGRFGAGKDQRTGIIDVAMMQSLARDEQVCDWVKDYGMVLVDECHHVPAFTFDHILQNVNARYIYGLTATPTRKDGHHPIVFMQCGPIRFHVDPRQEAEKRGFRHYLIPRFTGLKPPIGCEEWSIQDCYREIVENPIRNKTIVNDVLAAIQLGRHCIILTERASHAQWFFHELETSVSNVILLTGQATAKEQRVNSAQLAALSSQPFVVVATGKFVGEGFDLPMLDTLFLAMPISWKGTLTQYVGRLHRQSDGKTEVEVWDYVDIHVKILETMYHKRLRGYRELGYEVKLPDEDTEKHGVMFDQDTFESTYDADLRSAKSRIVIVSPFIKRNRVVKMVNTILLPCSNGVEIVVVTRPPEDYRAEQVDEIASLLQIMKETGITVITCSKIHQKFTLIDQCIVWYGSLNFLSFGHSMETLLRFECRRLATELQETFEL